MGRKTDAKALFPVSDSWRSAYSGLIPHHTAPWQGRGAWGLWRKSQPDQRTYLGLLKPDSPSQEMIAGRLSHRRAGNSRGEGHDEETRGS